MFFSAFAFHYIDNLNRCFKEVYRVLKKKGLFVFSLDHPFYRTVNPTTLKLRQSYFKTGKVSQHWKNYGTFVMYNHTISELYDLLVGIGFKVERIVEPDSRKKYPYDPWYGLWDYQPKLLKMAPPTIIFKARK